MMSRCKCRVSCNIQIALRIKYLGYCNACICAAIYHMNSNKVVIQAFGDCIESEKTHAIKQKQKRVPKGMEQSRSPRF